MILPNIKSSDKSVFSVHEIIPVTSSAFNCCGSEEYNDIKCKSSSYSSKYRNSTLHDETGCVALFAQ